MRPRKPDWLKVKLGGGSTYAEVNKVLETHGLHTICSSGRCPNQGECWACGTASFLIAGDICTRSCRFCATTTGRPLPLDPEEPARIAQSVKLMALSHAVITSVDRDDLPDGGAAHWVQTLLAVRALCPQTTLEVLLPDFMDKLGALEMVLAERPHIAAHNLETVRRLTPSVRSRATYERSLEVVRRIAESGLVSKSGVMLGLGETLDEVHEAMRDLRAVGCEVLTLGQYLQPTHANFPVARYVSPEEFDALRETAYSLGFRYVESGPLVRSSFHAARALEACGLKREEVA